MRVKRGIAHTKKRNRLLKRTKGYRWRRKSKIKLAKTAVLKAGAHAYRDRRRKKRDFRKLWNIRINAAARQNDFTYSKLMNALKKAKIKLDRKMLADLAANEPNVFAEIAKIIK
ncbi:50S ribosomal protein L20 [Patescibacteria group bacterium]|nr:50S ribosomal protein L20 [Patescibacteria group bacterium]MBU0963843.1 50S ribosomal protein L20 [Patescibacteria group bacterium]